MFDQFRPVKEPVISKAWNLVFKTDNIKNLVRVVFRPRKTVCFTQVKRNWIINTG